MTATSFARGVNKLLAINKEATSFTLANTTGAKLLRRVNGSGVLNKDAFQSQEILASQQLRDARHGVRRAAFSLNGQLAPGSYQDLWEGMLRANASSAATTGALTNVTAAVTSGSAGTFTRAAGSFITDGFKIGDVVGWSGWATTGVPNNTTYFRITALTATVMTVIALNGGVVGPKASGDSVTGVVKGKKIFTPATSQVFNTYSIEQLYPDTSPVVSERFYGLVMQLLRINMPATGLMTFDAQMVGIDMLQGTAAYFTSPTAQSSYPSLSSVSGALRLNGADVALVTAANINIQCGIDANPVVGSNKVPFIFQGVIVANGTLTVYFTDDTYLDLFDNETECDLQIIGTSDSTFNSDFVSFNLPRIKLMSFQKNDSDRSIVATASFQALEKVTGAGAGTAFDQTTISIQDSQAA